MTAKQEKALEILVSGDFNTYDEVAERVKVSRRTLYNWRKDEEFMAEIKKRVNFKMSGITPKALRRLEKLIDATDERIALSACKDVLDRAGYKAIDKIALDGSVKTNETVCIAFKGALEEWSE